MKRNNEKRSYPIQFKVNEKEKAHIEQEEVLYQNSCEVSFSSPELLQMDEESNN